MTIEDNRALIEDQDLYDAKFRELFSKIGKEYTSDYFSDLTRKRQISLLVSSFVAILISYKFIIPKELPTQLMSGTISGTTPVEFIAGFISLYFLISFIMSTIQDEKGHKFSILAATLLVSELRVLIEDRHKYLLHVKDNLRAEYFQKMARKDEKYFKALSEKEDEENPSRDPVDKNSIFNFPIPKPSKLVHAVEEFISSGKELDEIYSKLNSISLEPEAKKMEKLAELVQSDRSFAVRFRVALEKYFPIMLGVYALVVSFLGPDVFANFYNWIRNIL